MAFSRGVVGSVALCAVASALLAGCGSDSAEGVASATSQSAAVEGTTASAQPTLSASSTVAATTTDRAAADPLVGEAQHVSGSDWSATITVGGQLTRRESFTYNGVLAPVSIDVESGAVPAAPLYWKLHTLSGQTVDGASTSSVPNVIGDRPLDRAAEGLISFSSYSSSGLADDVAITEVALYPSATAKDPIARWAFPSPLAVRDIPPAAE